MPSNRSNRTLYGELPETAGNVFLYCPNCGSRYSATHGDYWYADDNEPIICRGEAGARHRPTYMFMAREVCQIINAKSPTKTGQTISARYSSA